MTRKKISILTPDLHNNCLGRAYLLAKILQRNYEVEIVGPMFGGEIWEPLANLGDIKYNPVKIERIRKSYFQLPELLEKIDGDIVYASKPLLTSLGAGLLATISSRQPLIADIDDWQMGLTQQIYNKFPPTERIKRLVFSALTPQLITSYWNHWMGEFLAPFASEITVSNHFLKNKFGGRIVWHARDTAAFDPSKFDGNEIRENLGIDRTKKTVMFFGTPRPHKGVFDLLEAVSLLKNKDIILIVVGLDQDGYSKNLITQATEKLGDRFKGFGMQSFAKVPEFLAVADIVVIPQRNNSATAGQLPAKIFDSMAMAKPTIATSVSDLPKILDNCGWIVEPEQPEQLAATIQDIIDHPEQAYHMGHKARLKCIEKYSFDAMEKVLGDILKRYE